MPWIDDDGNAIPDPPSPVVGAAGVPDEVDAVAAALDASDPDALRCDWCGVMPGQEHQTWCDTLGGRKAVHDVGDTAAWRTEMERHVEELTSNVDRLIALVEAALTTGEFDFDAEDDGPVDTPDIAVISSPLVPPNTAYLVTTDDLERAADPIAQAHIDAMQDAQRAHETVTTGEPARAQQPAGGQRADESPPQETSTAKGPDPVVTPTRPLTAAEDKARAITIAEQARAEAAQHAEDDLRGLNDEPVAPAPIGMPDDPTANRGGFR